jgi:hypothetical protein
LGWRAGAFDEAVRVGAVCGFEGSLSGGRDFASLSVGDLAGRHQADASVVMIAVVPIEEMTAESLGILHTAEALGKMRLVFERIEAAFRERIIV